MSTINRALSKLANKADCSGNVIERATVKPIKTKPVWPWLIGGFSMSLAIGGWAVSQQQPIVLASSISAPLPVEDINLTSVVTNGARVTNSSEVTSRYEVTNRPEVTQSLLANDVPTSKSSSLIAAVYSSPKADVMHLPKKAAQTQVTVSQTELKTSTKRESDPIVSTTSVSETSPVLLANTKVKNTREPLPKPAVGEMLIKQVELTPQELAEKARDRGDKALESNNLKSALSEYNEAIRYLPSDENTRQKLAALYYGQANSRKAFDLLQTGIQLNNEGETLRIALSKLLIKESQSEAALTPLQYMPPQPSRDYLALRAALAQKVGQDEMALESYQALVDLDSANGRWWLGLAIQQERSLDLDAASLSYQQALTKVGLSKQSHQFIRDRLQLLNSLQEKPNAD